jgi:hypothetical protein
VSKDGGETGAAGSDEGAAEFAAGAEALAVDLDVRRFMTRSGGFLGRPAGGIFAGRRDAWRQAG